MKKHRGGSSRPPRFKYACTTCGTREVKLSGRTGSDGRGIYQCATCGAMRDQAPPHFAPITTVHAPEVLPGRDQRREAAIAWAESIGAPPTGVLAVDTLDEVARVWHIPQPRREREEFVFDETALKALASKMRPWFTKTVGA